MILVTGASGLLGATFVMTAQQRQKHLVGTFHEHPVHLPGVKTVRVNLTDPEIAGWLLQYFKPEWVVHCAGLTNVDWCEDNPEQTWQVNAEASRHLARACNRLGASLVYLSTDSVFTGIRGHYSEEESPGPVNVYGRSKLAGEQAVQSELEHSLIIRTNIYGWNQSAKLSLAEWILSHLESGQSVPGFFDVVFTPILVNDLSEILLDMMDRKLSGLYHVASSESSSKYEFALQLADVFGMEKQLIEPVSVAAAALRAPRPRNTSLATAKIHQVLGRRMPHVRSGLERFNALRNSGYVQQLKALKEGADAKA